MMRKLSAHYIFPGCQPPLKYGILVLDDNGTVTDLVDTGGKLKEESSLEFYPGIITPGFVNAHCHLELSHMQGMIPAKLGMTGFIERISKDRFVEENIIHEAIRVKAAEMFRSGTSAVADIVNTPDTIREKQKSPVFWHSFIELFGLQPEKARKIWRKGNELLSEFQKARLRASISPHAPYTISLELWNYFSRYSPEMLTIHNQESKDEENIMCRRDGKMADWFIDRGYDLDNLPSPKESSLESHIDFLPEAKRILYVHNTYSTENDFRLAIEKTGFDRVFWVTCPNANLHIEGRLPDKLFMSRDDLQICIGTDSLASNSSLSMIEEIKTINNYFPEIPLAEIFNWACLNGAKALGVEDTFGSFEKGKKPGAVWIKSISFPNLALKPDSRSFRLI